MRVLEKVCFRQLISSAARLLFCVLVLTTGCARRVHPTAAILIDPSFPKEASLAEIMTLHQRESERRPSLKGLIEVTLQEKVYKRFWAKWHSHAHTVKIDGFDLLGGSLFTLEMDRGAGDDHQQATEIIFRSASSESSFQGSRNDFIEGIRGQARPDEMLFEWLNLIDWLARFGLPPYAGGEQTGTSSHHIALEKQEKRYILYLFSSDGKPSAQLDQKIVIEREGLRITEVLKFDAGGAVRARMIFGDYRPINPTPRPATADGLTDRIIFPYFATLEEGGLQAKIVFKELKWLPSAPADIVTPIGAEPLVPPVGATSIPLDTGNPLSEKKESQR